MRSDDYDRYEFGAVLTAPAGTVPEHWTIAAKWQHNLFGGFYAALCKAIALADEDNAARLRLAFPEHVKAIKGWQHGTLAIEIQDYCDAEQARRAQGGS